MAAEDLDEVLALERQSYVKPWSRGQFSSELTNPVSYPSTLWVTSAGEERLAGYIIFWIVYGEAHVLNLTVRSEFRRRGLATWMMESAFALMEEFLVYHVFLEVRRSNTAARELYRKLGFKESFERKNYYGDEDAIVMTLAM
jgi:ribosomal-protein-alanine N-acetyltransferase